MNGQPPIPGPKTSKAVWIFLLVIPVILGVVGVELFKALIIFYFEAIERDRPKGKEGSFGSTLVFAAAFMAIGIAGCLTWASIKICRPVMPSAIDDLNDKVARLIEVARVSGKIDSNTMTHLELSAEVCRARRAWPTYSIHILQCFGLWKDDDADNV